MKQTDNSHTPQVSVAVIDNYDSFTYNLVHLVRSLGAQVTVFRNDQFDLPDLADYDKLLLSPGPGIPSEAGLLFDVIRTYAATKPILGVCLGHQAIGEVFGARLTNLAEVFHGVGPRVPICSATTSSATFLHALPWAVITLGWSRGRLCQPVWRSLPRATRALSWHYAIATTTSMASSSIQRVCSRPRAPLSSATG